jgi:hypothetical protein
LTAHPAGKSRLTIVLRAIRCFNAAAFAALAFYYFASYCLPTFSVRQQALVPADALPLQR